MTVDDTTITTDSVNQFSLLQELDELFTEISIRYWLRGGWALDFMLGKITRSHSDIDLVAWKEDAVRIKELLVASGFDFERDLGVQMDFTKVGQDISVIYVAQNDMGQVFTPDIPDWIWLPDSLSLPPCQLNGLTCQAISPEQLLAEKEKYQQNTGRPPRPKDLRSIEILRQFVG